MCIRDRSTRGQRGARQGRALDVAQFAVGSHGLPGQDLFDVPSRVVGNAADHDVLLRGEEERHRVTLRDESQRRAQSGAARLVANPTGRNPYTDLVGPVAASAPTQVVVDVYKRQLLPLGLNDAVVDHGVGH